MYKFVRTANRTARVYRTINHRTTKITSTIDPLKLYRSRRRRLTPLTDSPMVRHRSQSLQLSMFSSVSRPRRQPLRQSRFPPVRLRSAKVHFRSGFLPLLAVRAVWKNRIAGGISSSVIPLAAVAKTGPLFTPSVEYDI